MTNTNSRLRRARKTRAKIAELKVTRLSVHRTNTHIYAQIIAESGDKVLASASTLEAEVRKSIKNGGNIAAAAEIGKRIAAAIKPKFIRVAGYWYPRGGIPIDIFWQSGKLPTGVWLPETGVQPYRGRG